MSAAAAEEFKQRQLADASGSPGWSMKLYALELEQQTRVELGGLNKRPELNGQVGVIVGRSAEKRRYRVRLCVEGAGAELALRPDNLCMAPTPEEEKGQGEKSPAPQTDDITSVPHHTGAYPMCPANQRRIYPWADFEWGCGDGEVEQMPWEECVRMLERRLQAAQAAAAKKNNRREVAELKASLGNLRQTRTDMQAMGSKAQENWSGASRGQRTYTEAMKLLLAHQEERELGLPAADAAALRGALERGEVPVVSVACTSLTAPFRLRFIYARGACSCPAIEG
jgi:hypothetical protein